MSLINKTQRTAIKIVAAGLLLPAAPALDAAGIFTVSERELFLDGSVFEVQGICCQPTPADRTGNAPPHGDYYTAIC